MRFINGKRKERILIICPNPARWFAIAAGFEEQDSIDALLAHAANCDQCSVELQHALRVFAENDDAAENQFLESLPSAQPAWRKQLAENLAAISKRQSTVRGGWSWKLVAAGFAVLSMTGAFFWQTSVKK